VSKKRKRAADEPAPPEEHFRSFRKIVEAIPWRDTDLVTERRNPAYLDRDGEFCRYIVEGKVGDKEQLGSVARNWQRTLCEVERIVGKN